MTATKLLDQVIGTQPTLAKIAQGYGRVATTAHPLCSCKHFAWSTCPQHVGRPRRQPVRADRRSARGGGRMTVTMTVAPTPRTKPGMMASLVNPAWCAGSPPVDGMYAEVQVDGATYEVSQMPGETEWTVDAAYAPGSSCPAFSNGFGARYLRTKVLRPEVAAVIDAAVSPRRERCHAHDLPGIHECTALCTADCDCKGTRTE